ncbi:hypothetical protein LXL04_000716 [Taraxacum kok-saghyz]
MHRRSMEKYFGNAYRGDPRVPHFGEEKFLSIWVEEGFDEYENIDFVVDKDENDENRVNNDDERQKKKKRNKR